jgi:hypothetical protein
MSEHGKSRVFLPYERKKEWFSVRKKFLQEFLSVTL